MAAGDITITDRDIFGTRNVVIGTMEIPSGTWAVGGYAFTAALLGLAQIESVVFEAMEHTATTFLLPALIRSTGKVTLLECSGAGVALQQSNEDTSSSVGPIRFMAFGRVA